MNVKIPHIIYFRILLLAYKKKQLLTILIFIALIVLTRTTTRLLASTSKNKIYVYLSVYIISSIARYFARKYIFNSLNYLNILVRAFSFNYHSRRNQNVRSIGIGRIKTVEITQRN